VRKGPFKLRISESKGSLPAGEHRLATRLAQAAVVIGFVLAWQYLPTLGFLSSHLRIFDRFYISSPSEVGQTLADLVRGSNGIPVLWPYLVKTVLATVIGAAIGLLLGGLFGLIFSNSQRLSEIARPFVVLMNSVPRVALIPIFVLLAGPTVEGSTISVVATVFFLAFFNAFEGGVSVKQVMIENATLLGAGRLAIMWYVRRPMVVAWTLAAVPNAISFGLVVAVTTELLAGIQGMGYLLLTSTTNVEASLTFAIIVALSVVGLLLFSVATIFRNRVLHWQGK
jgi:NitT/TauT family transport system permease protein